MSKVKRIQIRERYIEGWYRMDIEELLATTASNFIFEDPAEPGPVDRAMLPGYMQRWDQRTRAMGSNNQWQLSHEMRRDIDGILTDWLWWKLVNTQLQGAGLVLTGNEGVILERITYFDRP